MIAPGSSSPHTASVPYKMSRVHALTRAAVNKTRETDAVCLEANPSRASVGLIKYSLSCKSREDG